nr:uncharacterized protein LOC129261689 [Lytechinus pictus]
MAAYNREANERQSYAAATGIKDKHTITVIVDELEKRKYKVSGKVTFPKLRVDGQLTNCLTGDRVIYIEKPAQPVPRIFSFGNFRGKVFHANQVNKDQITCSNCLNKGHHRSACTNQIVCRLCKREGHFQRDCPNPGLTSEEGREEPIGKQGTLDTRERSQYDKKEPMRTVAKTTNHIADSQAGVEMPKRTATKATRRTADNQDATELQTLSQDETSGNTQSKITQFIRSERLKQADRVHTETSADESSDGDSLEIETDDCPESEVSIESPELPKTRSQLAAKKPAKKRKLKEKKSKKK